MIVGSGAGEGGENESFGQSLEMVHRAGVPHLCFKKGNKVARPGPRASSEQDRTVPTSELGAPFIREPPAQRKPWSLLSPRGPLEAPVA